MNDFETTLEELENKVKEATKAEDAAKYAEAYKAMKEADTLEWREAQKNDVEIRKAKSGFWGMVISGGIAAILTSAIKVFGDLVFQTSAQEFESEGNVANYRKHRR